VNYTQQIKEIIGNCQGVRDDDEMHSEARDLAELVIRDLNNLLREIQINEGIIQ